MAKQRLKTDCRIEVTPLIIIKSLKTDSRVLAAARQILKSAVSFSGVGIGVASVRCCGNRWSAGAKATGRNHNRHLDHKTGAAQSGERFKS